MKIWLTKKLAQLWHFIHKIHSCLRNENFSTFRSWHFQHPSASIACVWSSKHDWSVVRQLLWLRHYCEYVKNVQNTWIIWYRLPRYRPTSIFEIMTSNEYPRANYADFRRVGISFVTIGSKHRPWEQIMFEKDILKKLVKICQLPGRLKFWKQFLCNPNYFVCFRGWFYNLSACKKHARFNRKIFMSENVLTEKIFWKFSTLLE